MTVRDVVDQRRVLGQRDGHRAGAGAGYVNRESQCGTVRLGRQGELFDLIEAALDAGDVLEVDQRDKYPGCRLAIGPGLLVLLGAEEGDTSAEAQWLAHKVANLRIFSDANGHMNVSVKNTDGQVLIVSQFTLIANTRKGFRPSFVSAAAPEIAEPLVTQFTEAVASEGVPVATGIFGAHMVVELVNDGPVTIFLERKPKEG